MWTNSKTFNQLYWDKDFIEKRIKEQEAYLKEVAWRRSELFVSALAVYARFKNQLENIKKLQ
jgi:hypothetical protein